MIAHKFFNKVFDTATGLAILLSMDGKVCLINKIGANQLGYETNEIEGKTLTEVGIANQDTFTEFCNEVLKSKVADGTLKLKHKNGNSLMWQLNSRVIDFEGVDYILNLGNDYTEKLSVKKDLEIADKLYDLNLNRLHKTLLDLQKAKTLAEETAKIKQQFLANVSHEIRTPMNAIIGFSNILLKGKLTTKELQYTNAIKKSADNLMIIINEILDLSKLESGNFSFDETDFDLLEILDSVKMLFELRIEDKELNFDIELQENLETRLLGDPGRLYQILVNMVGNAIKFTEKGFVKIKITHLETRNDGIILKFSVLDSGIGIAKESIEKVFESFTQESNDTTRKYGGTGLGLTICKQMVELQGGKIYAESEVGIGSTFSFEMPYKLSAGNIKIETLKADYYYNQSDSLGKYKILLVEDNEINILLASKIIEDWGFQFSVAVNGLKAIQRLNTEHFDLVLMDVQMPEMDGYQATKAIRESDKKYKNIPIIATTAHASNEEAEKAIKIGMNDYVSKPFQLEMLLHKMLKLLNNENEKSSNKEEHRNIANSKLTNLDYVKRVAAGDKKFVSKMIELFITQSPEAVVCIREDMNRNDWENFRARIHKLLPSISFMGITVLNKELHQIDETRLKPENLQTFAWAVDQLELIINQACDELKEYSQVLSQ